MGFIYSRLKIKLSILHCVFDIKHGQIINFVLDWIQNIFETKNEVLYFKLFSPLFFPQFTLFIFTKFLRKEFQLSEQFTGCNLITIKYTLYLFYIFSVVIHFVTNI